MFASVNMQHSVSLTRRPPLLPESPDMRREPSGGRLPFFSHHTADFVGVGLGSEGPTSEDSLALQPDINSPTSAMGRARERQYSFSEMRSWEGLQVRRSLHHTSNDVVTVRTPMDRSSSPLHFGCRSLSHHSLWSYAHWHTYTFGSHCSRPRNLWSLRQSECDGVKGRRLKTLSVLPTAQPACSCKQAVLIPTSRGLSSQGTGCCPRSG